VKSKSNGNVNLSAAMVIGFHSQNRLLKSKFEDLQIKEKGAVRTRGVWEDLLNLATKPLQRFLRFTRFPCSGSSGG
jgi:hypothetical protein